MGKRGALAIAFCWFSVCLLLAIILSSCGGPKSGYVYTKRVVPAMSYIWLMPIVIGKTTTLVPVQQYQPECPELTLKADPTKSDTSTVCVDHLTYDHMNIGDYYQEPGK